MNLNVSSGILWQSLKGDPRHRIYFLQAAIHSQYRSRLRKPRKKSEGQWCDNIEGKKPAPRKNKKGEGKSGTGTGIAPLLVLVEGPRHETPHLN